MAEISPNLKTLFKFTVPFYNARLFPVPNALLRYIIFYYNAELFQMSMHCCAFPTPKTMLKYTPSFYNAAIIPFLSWKSSQIYRALLRCWAIPIPITLMWYILLFYIAEHFATSIHCWALSCFLDCYTFPNLNTMLRDTMSCYIAELLPILEPYWAFSKLKNLLRQIAPFPLLSCTQAWFSAEKHPI